MSTPDTLLLKILLVPALIASVTLAAVPSVPVAGMALILWIDRFMSECRAVTNFIGNSVATIVVSRWEGQFDPRQFNKAVNETLIDD